MILVSLVIVKHRVFCPQSWPLSGPMVILHHSTSSSVTICVKPKVKWWVWIYTVNMANVVQASKSWETLVTKFVCSLQSWDVLSARPKVFIGIGATTQTFWFGYSVTLHHSSSIPAYSSAGRLLCCCGHIHAGVDTHGSPWGIPLFSTLGSDTCSHTGSLLDIESNTRICFTIS